MNRISVTLCAFYFLSMVGCQESDVAGCADSLALNFNPEATIDDGSCVYGPAECGGYSTVTFDGYTYDLVVIGDQCWFAENLRTTVFSNGDVIPAYLKIMNGYRNNGSYISAWRRRYDCNHASPEIDACDEIQALTEYGRLYNWYAVDDTRGLCPSGWHVPSVRGWSYRGTLQIWVLLELKAQP